MFVSILILLDILLLQVEMSNLKDFESSFNPYFTGYTTFTLGLINLL